MKTLLTLLATIIFIAACKKQKPITSPSYECNCKIEVGTGVYTKNSTYVYENMTRNQASQKCSSLSGMRNVSASYDETWTCNLK